MNHFGHIFHFFSLAVIFSKFLDGIKGAPGVLGIWGEWLFIFRELGSTCDYFQGFRKQAQSFGDLGSPAKK